MKFKNHTKHFESTDCFGRREVISISKEDFDNLKKEIRDKRQENREMFGYTSYIYSVHKEALNRLGV